MFRHAVRNRVFQDVVYQIQEAILDGRLKPGDRLPSERELGEAFKTSRGTMREALRVLEHRGLIEIRLGVSGGAVVKSVNNEQMCESLGLLIRSQEVSLDHLAEFREGVEGNVAAIAAQRADETDVLRLKDLLAVAWDCCRKGPSYRSDFIRADEKLHMAIAQITGNPLYTLTLQTVHDNINRYYDVFLPMDEREIRENYEDLSLIVGAIERGAASEASRLAQHHVQRFNRYMKERERLLVERDETGQSAILNGKRQQNPAQKGVGLS